MSGNNWMGKYIMQKNPHMYQIVMPGSHDAGVFESGITNAGSFGLLSTAICQSGDLGAQLNAGSRVFDLRLREVRTKNRLGNGEHSRVRFFHGGEKTGTKGGGLLLELVKVKAFLVSNPSEFCVLRFTKTKCPDEVIDIVKNILGSVLYKQAGNLAKHRVNQMQGKVICVFDSTFAVDKKQTDGIHNYEKNAECKVGLGIAGSYSGSPFAGRVMKDQKNKLQTYKENLNGDRLYAWYQTQTYLPSLKWQSSHGVGAKSNIKKLKDNLAINPEYDKINIVMMDFVNNYKCRQIYRRNDIITESANARANH